MKTISFSPAKAIMIAFLLIIWITTVNAQETGLNDADNTSTEKTFDKALRFNLIGFAGINYEEGIGGPFTLNFEAGLGYPVISGTNKDDDGTLNVAFKTLLNPYVRVESRCYYNLDQRKFSGKDVSNFAASFLSVYYKYQVYGMDKSGVEENNHLDNNVNQFGLMWGMQRNMGCNNGMYFNFAIGPAVRTNLTTSLELIPSGYLGLGFQW